jgi:ABC-type multidrug transport system ATPase subunit
MNSDLMIETRGLTKTFGDLVAVNGLDLSVRKGRIHGFVGPNGAGKTTTMKKLIGSIRGTTGEAFINGHPAGSVEARRALGYSPERPSFYWDMTAWDYLVYMSRLSGMNLDAAEKRTKELLIWLDLGRFYNAKVGGFSAGMKQRLSLAQAMAHQPQLLILDEPTANLDPDGRMSLLEKLKQLCREQQLTIFISSHILPELEQLVDAVTLIEKGRTVAEDSVKNLKQAVTLDHYLLKTSSNEAVLKALQGQACVQEMRLDSEGFIHLTSSDLAVLQNKVIGAVTGSGALIEHFGREQASLQEIYRRTMGKDK